MSVISELWVEYMFVLVSPGKVTQGEITFWVLRTHRDQDDVFPAFM